MVLKVDTEDVQNVLQEIRNELAVAAAGLNHYKEQTDQLYRERTALAAALARNVIANGGVAGVGYDATSTNPFVIYIDTPSGQVSYHVAPDTAWMLKGIPPYEGKWDGTYRGREGHWALWGCEPES